MSEDPNSREPGPAAEPETLDASTERALALVLGGLAERAAVGTDSASARPLTIDLDAVRSRARRRRAPRVAAAGLLGAAAASGLVIAGIGVIPGLLSPSMDTAGAPFETMSSAENAPEFAEEDTSSKDALGGSLARELEFSWSCAAPFSSTADSGLPPALLEATLEVDLLGADLSSATLSGRLAVDTTASAESPVTLSTLWLTVTDAQGELLGVATSPGATVTSGAVDLSVAGALVACADGADLDAAATVTVSGTVEDAGATRTLLVRSSLD